MGGSGNPFMPVGSPSYDGRTPIFVELGADPSLGAGHQAPIGSIARFGTSYFLKTAAGATAWSTSFGGVTAHGALTGLANDDHAQYALLAGRAGGQALTGGTAASNNLDFRSTSHATRGLVRMGPLGGGSADFPLVYDEKDGDGAIIMRNGTTAAHRGLKIAMGLGPGVTVGWGPEPDLSTIRFFREQIQLWASTGATRLELDNISGAGHIRILCQNAVFVDVTQARWNMGGRFNLTVGPSNVSAATTITLGAGNSFKIIGATTIDFITTTDFQTGAEITLYFDSNPTVRHNVASPPGGTSAIFLRSEADLVTTATKTVLHLILFEGFWREYRGS